MPLTRLSYLSFEDWAEKLTEMGQGKHHIGDFLPPDELDRFMETYRVSLETLMALKTEK